MQLTGIRELLLSGSTPLLLPQLLLSNTFQQQQQQQQGLQLLVLQQQLGLWELQTLLQRFSGLKYLEVLGFWEAAGAVQALGPVQGLLQESQVVRMLGETAKVGCYNIVILGMLVISVCYFSNKDRTRCNFGVAGSKDAGDNRHRELCL
jgi:hypothetical protein